MHNRRYLYILIVTLLLIAGGAAMWILNIEDLIKGPWSNIMGVFFTVVGTIFAFLQWYEQVISTALTQGVGSQTNQSVNLSVNQQKGALIIYTKKRLRGTNVHLFRGFDAPKSHADLATSIIKRTVHGRCAFVGVFPDLEPGNYRVLVKDSCGRVAGATVYANEIAEIDWS